MAAAVRITVRDQLQWALSCTAMEINDSHLSPEDGHCVGVFVIFMDTTLQPSVKYRRNKLDLEEKITQNAVVSVHGSGI